MSDTAIDELEELVQKLMQDRQRLKDENVRLTNSEAALLQKCIDAEQRIGQTIQQLKQLGTES